MKGISEETKIRVYFDELLENMTYAVDINGKLNVLKDSRCDTNDVLEIRELAGYNSELPYEWQKVIFSEMHEDIDNEYTYQYYYEVRNGDLITPFEDVDIEYEGLPVEKRFLIKYKKAHITAILYIQGDNYNVNYMHPLDGSENQIIEQCLYGWSEQKSEDQHEWNELVRIWNETNPDVEEEVYWGSNDMIDLEQYL
jgi:hypothetical protein